MTVEKGLIVAYLLDGAGGGKPLGWDEVLSWTPGQGLLWVHLDFTSRNAVRWLSKQSGLDAITAKAMTLNESRPRCEISAMGVLLFLRGVNLNPRQDPEDMVSIRVWLDKNRIITTRKRKLLSVDDIRQSLESGNGPKDPEQLLCILNERLVDRMSDVIEDMDESVDGLEEEIVTAESYTLRPKIADARRQSIMMRRYLAPQREALSRLYLAESNFLSHTNRLRIRETMDRVVRYIEDLDSIRERASVYHEELSSRLSEQMDKRMYLLSVVAVIFLPLSFITGLLGINVGGIPGADYKWAFLLVCSSLFAALGVMVWFFHRKKWI